MVTRTVAFRRREAGSPIALWEVSSPAERMPEPAERMPEPAGAEPGARSLCPRSWVARQAQKSEQAVRCPRSGQGVRVPVLDFVGQTPGRRSLG